MGCDTIREDYGSPGSQKRSTGGVPHHTHTHCATLPVSRSPGRCTRPRTSTPFRCEWTVRVTYFVLYLYRARIGTLRTRSCTHDLAQESPRRPSVPSHTCVRHPPTSIITLLHEYLVPVRAPVPSRKTMSPSPKGKTPIRGELPGVEIPE